MRLAVVLLCVALPVACGPKTKVATPVRQAIAETPPVPPPYIIGPGDELAEPRTVLESCIA